MKLRIRHNSIRLRLTQTEVTQLRDAGTVEEHIEFEQGQRLTYRIHSDPDRQTLNAEYRDGAEADGRRLGKLIAGWNGSSRAAPRDDRKGFQMPGSSRSG